MPNLRTILYSLWKSVFWPETVFATTFRKHVLIFTGCLYFVLLPVLLHDRPQSVYYGMFNNNVTAEKRVTFENEKRIFESSIALDKIGDSYLKKVHTFTNTSSTFEKKPRLNIVVATVSRSIAVKNGNYSPKYLTQVTAKFVTLISELDEGYPFHVDFCLCNMDPRPNAHAEAHALKKYVPVHTKPAQVREWRWHLEQRLKEGYVYCLNHSATIGRSAATKGSHPDFVFVIEDDAIPNDDLFAVLETTIHRHLSDISRQNQSNYHMGRGTTTKDQNSTVFIKFYHPDRLLGFVAFDCERLPELFAFSSCSACLLLALYYCLMIRHRGDILENVKVLYLVLFIISVGACLLIGRHNLIQFHKLLSPHLYYLTPSPSCCTQAVLYPRHRIHPLVSYLHNITCDRTFSIDHALDQYISQRDRHAYLVQPSVFDHVGMYSAHKRNKVNALLLV